MSNATVACQTLVRDVVSRIAQNVGTLIDKTIKTSSLHTEVVQQRVPGPGQIHISFRLCIQEGSERRHGCVLVPLPDAITMAAYLMMLPDPTVEESRGQTELDREMKDAMLELGNFMGGAANEVLQEMELAECSARSDGCQGVRPDMVPKFPHEAGTDLLVGRAKATIGDYPEFGLILMLPVLAGAV